jgi:hypothetical protein
MRVLPARGRQQSRARAALASAPVLFALAQAGLLVWMAQHPEARALAFGSRLMRLQSLTHASVERGELIVMLGSSRLHWGVLTRRLDAPLGEALGKPVGVANFAFDGHGAAGQLLTYHRLRQAGVRPSRVLIETFPYALHHRFEIPDTTVSYLPVSWMSWDDLPLVSRYTLPARPRLKLQWLGANAVPVYTQRHFLITRVFRLRPLLPLEVSWRYDEAAGDDDRGDRQLWPTSQDHWDRAARYSRKTLAPFLRPDFRPDSPGCRALAELLGTCRQDGVPALLIMLPEPPSYRAFYPPGAWEKTLDWLRELSCCFDIPLINAREWSDDEDDFCDCLHLSAQGAARFTDWLGRHGLPTALGAARGGVITASESRSPFRRAVNARTGNP